MPHWFGTEQSARSDFVNKVDSAFHACSGTLNNPAWLALPAGASTGSRNVPDPPNNANQDAWAQSWTLGAETLQRKWTLREDVVYGTDNTTPACSGSASSGNV